VTTPAGERTSNGRGDKLADHRTERSLLGAMLISRAAVNAAADVTQAAHFHHPAHGPIYDAILAVHSAPGGGGADVRTVTDELARRGQLDQIGGTPALIACQAEAPAVSNAARYAGIVARYAHLRDLRATFGRSLADVADPTDPPDVIAERARAALDELAARFAGADHGPRGLAAFRAQDHREQREDVIPGVLRRGRTLVLTGMPGNGKSLFVLQSALAPACGINPLTLGIMPRRRTLYVQLENEPDEEQDRIEGMLAGRNGELVDESLVDVQVRQGGVDLTTPAGAAWLRSLVRSWRPDLLCIGPYKNMHSGVAPVGASDRHAALAKAVHQPLDRIRREFGCAIVLEAHPTREADPSSDNPTDFLPAGGSEMERWTGLGLCLMRTERAGRYRLGAWREPRRLGTRLPGEMVRRQGSGWVWAPTDPHLHDG
jgi:hypothetical protein